MALASPSKPLSFLDLPAEIRAMIYVLAFKDLQITVHSRRARVPVLPSFGFREALLLRSTSRAIRDEVVAYISAQTTLVLEENSASQILPTIIPQQYLNNIKHVITNGCGREIRIDTTELPSLKFVEIHDGLYMPSTNSISDEDVVSKLLEGLTGAWSFWNVYKTPSRPFELVWLVRLHITSAEIAYKLLVNIDRKQVSSRRERIKHEEWFL